MAEAIVWHRNFVGVAEEGDEDDDETNTENIDEILNEHIYLKAIVMNEKWSLVWSKWIWGDWVVEEDIE